MASYLEDEICNETPEDWETIVEVKLCSLVCVQLC